MADSPNSSSCEPDGDNFDLGVERGIEMLHLDCSSSYLELPAIAVNVVSFLELCDVFSLGSCSKFLNELCECESTWKVLYIRRWGDPIPHIKADFSKGWKALYINKHKERAMLVHNIFELIESSMREEQLVSYHFVRVVEQMKDSNITFEDIYFFYFKTNINVIINFVALYYSYFSLRVPIEGLTRAVMNRHLADRTVCVRWTYPQNWDYRHYSPEENFTEIYSLGEIARMETPALYLFKQPNYRRDNIREVVVSNLSVSAVIPPVQPEPEPVCSCQCQRAGIVA